MPYFNKNDLPSKEMFPGLTLRAAWLENLMITMVDLDPGTKIPEHEHPHEQITYVVSGSLEMTVGTETRVLGPGAGVTIPPGVRHYAVTGDEHTSLIDSWAPVREDYKL